MVANAPAVMVDWKTAIQGVMMMALIQRFDHVGLTVDDLGAATAFFVQLGLEPDGDPQVVEGEFVSTVLGMDDVQVEVVMLRAPGATTTLELSKVRRPPLGQAPTVRPPTELGLRNICFEVDDVLAMVDQLAAEGYGLVGGIAEYEATYRMCYVRGPEGVIVSLAQNIAEPT